MQEAGGNDYGVVSPGGGNPNGVLPPMAGGNSNRKTLVLDLDGTLVHMTTRPMPTGYDFAIRVNSFPRPLYVLKRPGVDELLQRLGATGLYEIVVFTAAAGDYADAVVDGLLDSLPAVDSSDDHGNRKMNIIPPTHHLSCSHCRKVGDFNYVKDLRVLGRDLDHVILVDDRPESYYLQPLNAIPINSWEGEDSEDKTLFNITSFCVDHADAATDVSELLFNYIAYKHA